MSDKRERLHVVVSGIVQGVNFRYATRTEAQRLGLTGWVRNLRDGSVEVVAEGPRRALASLFDYLHHGPPHALVESVREEWGAASGEFDRFEIRW